MEPEEIMIGDLVIHGFGGIGKITEIDSKTVVIKDDGFDTGDGMNEVSFALNELTPIPLTPEILEQNGFIGDKNVCKTKMRDDSKDELWQCEYAWYLKNLRIKNRTNGSVARLYNIMFVHELQHALRLCGIDKEIEI